MSGQRLPRLVLLNRQRRVPFDLPWLQQAATLALPECAACSEDGRFALGALEEIVVAIVSDLRIAEIHRDFMGIEGPTDVITFDHGEIVVSAETARLHARHYHHPIECEMALYTIHGFLHLNGFDDLAPAPAARMRRTQSRILRHILKHLPMRLLSICLAALIATPVAAPAQQADAPAPDAAQILQFLQQLKEQQAQQIKGAKQKIIQEALAAAATPAAASAAWVEAVRITQFQGAEKEGAQFREWREKEGAAFSDGEVQRAAQFYFRWLALSAQKSLGTPTRELLPQIIQFTKDVTADHQAMETLLEKAQREKELAQSRLHGQRRDRSPEIERMRRVRDMVLHKPLNGGAPLKAIRGEELIKVDQWEMTPGNIDGIFTTIVLPELRAAKDPRILEYWDMRIQRESEDIQTKAAFEQEKFTQQRYPSLLWSRAQDLAAIGQPNRALGEMFKIVRTYPQHPDLGNWITRIESFLSKASASSATPPAAP